MHKILKIALANRNGAEIVLKEEDQNILFEQIKPHKAATKFKNLLDFAKEKLGINILLVVITQKNSNEKFKIPLQGKYLSDVSSFTKDYKDQNPGSANAENQIPDNLKRK